MTVSTCILFLCKVCFVGGGFALRHSRLALLFIFYLKRIELCNEMSFINEIAIANIN